MELTKEQKIEVVTEAIELISTNRCSFMCIALQMAINHQTSIVIEIGRSPARDYLPEFYLTRPESAGVRLLWYAPEDQQSRITHLQKFLETLKNS